MSEVLGTVLCWIVGLGFSGATIHALVTGWFQYRGGAIIRRAQRRVHYWLMMVVLAVVSLGILIVAVRRTLGI